MDAASPLPLRFDLEVKTDGLVEFHVPLPAGAHVTVVVTDESAREAHDLLAAAGSSTDFWENPFDDEDWNTA